MTRRDALAAIGPILVSPLRAERVADPRLAAGSPHSPERTALIEQFRKRVEGLQEQFEARRHRAVDGWAMPYRLFRPASTGTKLPLILYLHGAGGLGSDNEAQIAAGNVPGTRIWLLAENQKRFPCHVAAPQTDRGWIRYDVPRKPGGPRPNAAPGFGEGARAALDLVESLCREFPVDERRIYVTGNSMGGGGTWHMLAHGSGRFAAAVPVCGGTTAETGAESPGVPVWNFHGDADTTVPVAVSRQRIAARRAAGGSPVYTEYAGVGHNVGLWAYTEPELPEWLFAQRK